ncbi:MAG: hypothetical protein LBH95_04625 [Oscillospiraceae bacterium]|jgi:glycogenin glucosyltransferase|nr:hypothetical protein [Oscillospiraceae bacterium]
MRRAYVTFLMRDDGYLPGALVLAYALKLQTTCDCICLVTKDISERARAALRILYDGVIPIGEIRLKSSVTGGRSDRNVLLTRFEALRLSPDGGLGQYDKIILLDADVLPLAGYDELFSLPAPAGILMERRFYKPAYPHGARIPAEVTDRVKDDPSNMGVNAGLWVLTPSADEYGAVLRALRRPDVMALVRGFRWPEMQLATLLWSGRWTNIGLRYCPIGGHARIEEPYGAHFAGLKPWRLQSRSIRHYARYPDFRLWYGFYVAMYRIYPPLHAFPRLKRLWEFCEGGPR